MLNSIGLANPGLERFLARDAAARCASSACRSGSRSAASRRGEYAETCARLDDPRGRRDRAQPLVPERRRGARVRGRDRRRLPRGDRRSRSTRSSRPRAWDIAESRARSRPRARTGSRSSTRCAGSRSTRATLRPLLARGDRRLLRAGAEADRARRRLRVHRAPSTCRSSAWAGSRRAATRSSSSLPARAPSRSGRCCSPTPTRRRGSASELAAELTARGLDESADARGIAHDRDSYALRHRQKPCKSRKTFPLDRGARLLDSPLMVPPKTQAQAPVRSLDQRMEALKGPTTSGSSAPS